MTQNGPLFYNKRMNTFDSWNQLKQNIHQQEKKIYFREGQIWWIHIGVNIGTEIHGKEDKFLRPCLILNKTSSKKIFVIPLSSQHKKQNFFFLDSNNTKQSAIFHEAKYIDTKRLLRKKSKITNQELQKIKQNFLKHIQ